MLHGIGARGGEAVDSTSTSSTGEFSIRYARSADSTIQYFVSTVYHGIAYISGAIPPVASPDDATLTVFDTTSAPIPLAVAGRHILVFAPTDVPRRRVAEIYDLANDTIVTRVVPPGGAPLWTALVPAALEEFSSGPELGSNEAIRLVDGRVGVYAPVAPGLKRIAFTYALPPEAFPVSFPIEQPTGIIEMLVEDEAAEVSGAGLTEVAPTTIEGRMFRRFQAQSVPANAVISVLVPAARPNAGSATTVLVPVIAAVMMAALIIGLRRSRSRMPAPAVAAPLTATAVSPVGEVEALARQIAELDSAFAERPGARTGDERIRYKQQRDAIKRLLAERLAASSDP